MATEDASARNQFLRDRLLKLAREYRPSMDRDVLHSWGKDAAEAMREASEALEADPESKDSMQP